MPKYTIIEELKSNNSNESLNFTKCTNKQKVFKKHSMYKHPVAKISEAIRK